MRALQLVEFGTAADVLHIDSHSAEPSIAADEILLEVHAASVNPVDCAIRRGYGKDFFRSRSGAGTNAFPIRLGRDAAGTVLAVGSEVQKFRRGDRVYAAPTGPTLAEKIAVRETEAAHMPADLTFIEAASLPFVAMTAWNALVVQVGLTKESSSGKRVLITRGAGGVGSFAIQLLKAWGAYVAATCSARNVAFVEKLGPDLVIDYKTEQLDALGGFDVVFDSTFGQEARLLDLLKTHSDASYITITSPAVALTDQYGLQEGSRKADEMLAERTNQQAQLGRHYHWGFMRPDGAALATITALVNAGKIKPLVDRVFPLRNSVQAHEYCESGQARGKIIIDLLSES
jgi:reticulon-4-interacting protein 1, mitochondrial